ncbi:3'(2'),5'-bisphosphate nucleotidase [Lachnellula cervina]|uniref:3'(2'),5'-bisphosphate nucleotidase n=1 Tax=Lachnellula cervina TaxID=1316786 RepID=A0A7D8YM79_9HELO|nr:3'(2'),5'-bisphosphate nucleotidase [Lachnellula cervina]
MPQLQRQKQVFGFYLMPPYFNKSLKTLPDHRGSHKPSGPRFSPSSSILQVPRRILFISLIILILAAITKFWSRISLISHHLPSSKALYSTPTMSTYSKELEVAELAVQRAALLTKKVFHEKAKGTISKDDKSPVTIGDFGAQALIIQAIKKNFPDDEVVGEEEASTLRQDHKLRDEIWALVEGTKLTDGDAEKVLGGPIESVDAMLNAIDAGNSAGGSKGRIWALDPIDGTKGFLRGGQYAVCLALMVDGDVKVGVLGCPNLPVDDSAPLAADAGVDQTDSEGKGVLFSAVLGQGATSRPLGTAGLAKSQPIHMKPVKDITQATFCESVEAGHSSHGDQSAIATKLKISKPSVRMDSQAKYASIARGAGDIYLRLPVSATYQEKIWDHAAGDIIVREAGGQVTDSLGRRLDFSKGRTLAENKGVVAAPAAVHGQVLAVVMEVLYKK